MIFHPLVSLVFIYGLLTINLPISGQEINLRFQHITSDQGLSQNTVDCILQDSRGFMWFGTWNGLNRFDGYNFMVYKSETQGKSLSNNFVYSLCEDKNGNIWVGTKNGLNFLDYATNQFTNLFHDPNNSNSIASNRINIVYCDHNGFIWVGTTDNGLDRIEIKDKTTFTITHYKNTPGDPKSLPSNEINSITSDRSGNLWVGTNQGLYRFNHQTKSSKTYKNNPFDPATISYNQVLSIYEEKSGTLWIGTFNGLNRLNPTTEKFERFFSNPDNPKSLSHLTVNAIAEDSNGNLLVGTLGGLNRLDKKDNSFYHFPVNQNDDYSLNNEFVSCIFPDKQGNVWIGTDKGGINKYNANQKEFGYIAHVSGSLNSLSYNTINSVLDESSVLWVGTAGGGLNYYDKQSKTFRYFKNSPHDASSINSNFITSLCPDNKQNLWIGTWGGGLEKMMSAFGNGRFQHHVNLPDPKSICNSFISSLWYDKKGFMMVGTLGGLDMFYPDKESGFKHLASNPNWKNKITEVGCIIEDKKGYYWVGTRYGLYRVHGSKLENELKDNDLTHFTNTPNQSNSLPGNYIISLCEDHNGDLWVGTYGNGIGKLHVQSDNSIVFTNYTQRDGLCNNVAYAIIEDNYGILWISTDNGLSRFDPKQNRFKNFYVTDGLQSNQFYWSAAYKNKEGKLFFGGIKGLNFFMPDSIKDNSFIPKVAITDFKIYNNTVNIGLWNDKKVILSKTISETSEINLSYKENVFSFEFSALDYFLPEKSQYQYKMEGVDLDWVTVPASRRFVTYTNLKGGDYIFSVKASNSDGVWNDNPTKLKIHISPPFWATIWFRVISIISISIIILTYFRFRTMRLETQKRVLEIMVKERTAKIEEQKKELEIQAQNLKESNTQLGHRQKLIEGQKEQLEKQNLEISDQRDKLIELNKRVQLVNQLKLRFFTNISHEFRTPLTLILGPLDKLISSWKGDKETLSTLGLINRNAQRLLHLINQLMEFRKIETGKLDLKVSKGVIEKFLENIFASFQHLASQRNIEYTFNRCNIEDEQWFDHEKIENIVYNLLSNAFKFTPEKGSINLSVSIHKKTVNDTSSEDKKPNKGSSLESYIEIIVKDSGIGISQEHINHIFKRFYQVNSPESLKVRGSGIGLSLTKELVKAHHGHITVESVKGQGSVFTLQIPFLKQSFSEKEIVNDAVVSSDNFQEQVTKLAEELLSEKPVVAVPEISQQNNNADKPLILIAEDNFDLRSFLTASLLNEFRVLDSENGKEAYELAKVHNPDLIISDVMMPEMDGLEFCSRLKSNLLTSHIPVVLLTARSLVENWIEGFETGADDYIPKPFDINLLIVRIKNLIESRRKLKKHFSRELTPDPTQIASSNADEQFLKKALEIVEQNFPDPTFGVEEFVEKMCISRSLLHKKLSALTDQSAGDFITALRLKKAAQLLHLPNKNISDVAYDVGFNDPKYFSRIFRKYFGTSPSEYVNN
jgi:signal transduction histidine kinase/ligand-binding sensor domain-containing protein/AraC-like DNA-binding protein